MSYSKRETNNKICELITRSNILFEDKLKAVRSENPKLEPKIQKWSKEIEAINKQIEKLQEA